ncbi:hypothetical protein DCE94_02750 [Agromyces badenianii]|nr:hypothetical protein DCE94_02750 [Agromyces badenianii]
MLDIGSRRQRILAVEHQADVFRATPLALGQVGGLTDVAAILDRDDPVDGEQHDRRGQPPRRCLPRHEPDRQDARGLGVDDGQSVARHRRPQPRDDERADADGGGQRCGERDDRQDGRAEAAARGCRELLCAGAGIGQVCDDLRQCRDEESHHGGEGTPVPIALRL